MVKCFLIEADLPEKLTNLINAIDEDHVNNSDENLENNKVVEKYFDNNEMEEKKLHSYLEVYTLSVAWVLFETLI